MPLRVRTNHAPVQAYAVPVNNSGCMHAGVSLPFALYGIDPDGGHIATFDVDWNSDGVFDSTGVPASDPTSNTANVNHTFALPGTYYITVRAHDDDGGATFTDVYTVQTVVIADTSAFIGAATLYLLTVGPVRGFAFFLGLSTILDVTVAWFFTRPVVGILSRRKNFTAGSFIGVPGGAS